MAAAPEPVHERGASSIPCDDFQSGKDDFEAWIERFQAAVDVATNAPAGRKNALYLQWLPLKLDDEARAVLKQVPTGTDYTNTINLMKDLLIDEFEVYKWKAMKSQILWDGKESFQALSTRVKRAVDKYEKELPADSKEWAYFFRFRAALPEIYQDYIDVGLPKDSKTIDNAKQLALRVQMTQRDKSSEEKQVPFTGAAMNDDRIHALEMQMAELKTQQNNDQSKKSRDDRRDSRGSDRYDRSQSRDHGGYQSSYKTGSRYSSPYPNRGRYESRYPPHDSSYTRDNHNYEDYKHDYEDYCDKDYSDEDSHYCHQGNGARYRSQSPRNSYRSYQSGRDNRDDTKVTDAAPRFFLRKNHKSGARP